MGALQPLHLLLILLIVLVIFGAGRLGEVGGALGKGIRDFRASAESGKGDAAKTAASRYCPNCGRAAVEGGTFCQGCGARLPAQGA